MSRVKVQVKVETARNAPPWYGELFRALFPEEWREFAERLFRERGLTLMQTFALNEVELVKATMEAPPVERFCELINARYFPLPDHWLDWVGEAEEGDEYAWHEIPVYTFFESIHNVDPHDLMPVFQLLGTLAGDVPYDAKCRFKDCDMRAVYLIAANELHKVDERMLAGFCRAERTPLTHLAFALRVMNQDTGNIWFDYCDEMYGGTGCNWEADVVRSLKREYDAASKQADDVLDLNNWLVEDVRRVRDVSALWRMAAV